ncbi:amino acid transporter [Mycolicibacterium sp. BK556]|uniref:APC family permease n=1 Tax=Mycobacteriaceae TaxID=1762 RepID=UPI00105D4B21|nr:MULTISPECIES: APC family permease [Mycobacteriaceae]MBB3602395.1 amino acid transporter [Mycolicibacterium sp. BK556]MBB3632147.1 amino acid transporter [Mycolicibacterium sp. BK607]MBB3750168.1 amino acid transporter [Mycolicibacterium sp. BK634]TDO18563.1 amino acid transporter [Mycobacterium sp. BK086]
MSKGELTLEPPGPAPSTVESKGLKGGALGLVSSIVVGMASTAPAYSLAATLGLIVASGGALLAGVKAPAIVLVAFIPMYMIAVAYQELNKAEPDCGTTFTWASRAFGPLIGWLGGWGIIAADVIVMANLAQIAGAYSFTFVGELGWSSAADLANSTLWSTVAGVIWIIVMTYICYRGIEVSARLQYGLLGIELVVLVVFSVVALIKVYTHHAEGYSLLPSLSWFWPGGLDFGTVIAPAILTAIFIYWGWDTAVACNEESDDPGTTPGRAAVISTFLLLATYALVSVAAIAFAGTGTEGIGLGNPDNAADAFAAIGPALFGDSVLGHIGLLLLSASILTSASASTQTTILPTARTTLSMGVYKALPESFAKIHRNYLTPTTSTVMMGVVSIVFYVLFTLVSPNLLSALIGSVGLMIAFYYGLTGFACAWFYRKDLTKNVRDFMMRGVIPLLGGLILLVVFAYGLIQYAKPDWLTDDEGNNVTIFGFGAVAVVGIGALVLGVILMVVWWLIRPDFFLGRTLSRRSSADLVLEPATAVEAHFGLPDSGDMPTVIAPDLSNLPPGETAVNPETGEEFTRGPQA